MRDRLFSSHGCFFSEITQHNLNKPWIGLLELDDEEDNVGNDDDSDSGAENETLGTVKLDNERIPLSAAMHRLYEGSRRDA